MSRAATSYFNTGLAEEWLNSGIPINNALRAAPTLALALGRPKKVVKNVVGMPKVEFEKMIPLSLEKKTINVMTAFGATMGGDIARGSAMLAPSSVNNPNLMDTLQFVSSFYKFETDLSLDQLIEGKGSAWIPSSLGGETYEQLAVNQMLIDYVNQTRLNMFATGANKMGGDGTLGSLRAMISDGLTTATRSGGSGTDESNYRYYAGYDRVASDVFRSYYYEANSAAFTEEMGDRVAAEIMAKGAMHIVAPMSIARFNAFQQRLRSTYGALNTKETPPEVAYALGGTSYITVGLVTYYIEPAIPASATWQLFIDTASLAAGSTFADTKFETTRLNTREAAYQVWGWAKHQVIVTAPNRCGIIEELASIS